MENSKRTLETIQIEKIKEHLAIELSYNNLKEMNRNDFKDFGIIFFKWLDNLKNKGLKKEDIEEAINKIYYNESCYFEEDLVFEERLYIIVGEIISFCASPFFWDISIEEFNCKWIHFFDYNDRL
ncbi:MAG: hypothetical protein ACRCVU_17000 [Flavobacterium sp.]